VEPDETASELDARIRNAWERLDRIEVRLGRVTTAEGPGMAAEENAGARPGLHHILFVPSEAGYVLVEREGMVPAPGEMIALPDDETSYTVVKVVDSPLPGDARVCAYLQLT
jgi:hypothetical protein